jgi:hypothetical protein
MSTWADIVKKNTDKTSDNDKNLNTHNNDDNDNDNNNNDSEIKMSHDTNLPDLDIACYPIIQWILMQPNIAYLIRLTGNPGYYRIYGGFLRFIVQNRHLTLFEQKCKLVEYFKNGGDIDVKTDYLQRGLPSKLYKIVQFTWRHSINNEGEYNTHDLHLIKLDELKQETFKVIKSLSKITITDLDHNNNQYFNRCRNGSIKDRKRHLKAKITTVIEFQGERIPVNVDMIECNGIEDLVFDFSVNCLITKPLKDNTMIEIVSRYDKLNVSDILNHIALKEFSVLAPFFRLSYHRFEKMFIRGFKPMTHFYKHLLDHISNKNFRLDCYNSVNMNELEINPEESNILDFMFSYPHMLYQYIDDLKNNESDYLSGFYLERWIINLVILCHHFDRMDDFYTMVQDNEYINTRKLKYYRTSTLYTYLVIVDDLEFILTLSKKFPKMLWFFEEYSDDYFNQFDSSLRSLNAFKFFLKHCRIPTCRKKGLFERIISNSFELFKYYYNEILTEDQVQKIDWDYFLNIAILSLDVDIIHFIHHDLKIKFPAVPVRMTDMICYSNPKSAEQQMMAITYVLDNVEDDYFYDYINEMIYKDIFPINQTLIKITTQGSFRSHREHTFKSIYRFEKQVDTPFPIDKTRIRIHLIALSCLLNCKRIKWTRYMIDSLITNILLYTNPLKTHYENDMLDAFAMIYETFKDFKNLSLDHEFSIKDIIEFKCKTMSQLKYDKSCPTIGYYKISQRLSHSPDEATSSFQLAKNRFEANKLKLTP